MRGVRGIILGLCFGSFGKEICAERKRKFKFPQVSQTSTLLSNETLTLAPSIAEQMSTSLFAFRGASFSQRINTAIRN